jgi:hypothetical protein
MTAQSHSKKSATKPTTQSHEKPHKKGTPTMKAQSHSKKSTPKPATHSETKDTPAMTAHSHSEKSPAPETSTASETITEIAHATPAPSATPPAPAPAPPLAAATPTSSTPTATSPSIDPPPADAKIPVPPATAVPTNGSDYRGVQPKVTEQAALSAALADLQKFSSYTQLLGGAAPPIAHVIVLLTLGVEWTGMRNATDAWDTYCRTQEGLVWAQIRLMMDRLKPAWDLAVGADATLITQFPGLASFLGAKKAIAQKAVSTRAANKKAIAEGKPPLHGAVGRERKRAAKNAAYAASTSTPPAQPAPAAASASPSEPAPVAVAAAGGASPLPAVTPTPAVTSPSGSLNGAAHS